MNIEIKNISKIYGSQKALNGVSFNVEKGEILGFLGPNGAGKSTLMKIMTTLIDPNDGEILIDNKNISENKDLIKKNIGYLPEHNPLYYEMYIKEFLMFIARIHKLKNKKDKIAEVIKKVGLEKEQHKKIGQLSKGYKQRVGIAQALIHNPEILILDEPTSGLDPNQIIEIRNLIKEISKDKTIVFSTHIMQEVETLCDKVVILNNGYVIAYGKKDEVLTNKSSQYVEVEFDKNIELSDLQRINLVSKIKNNNNNSWYIYTKDNIDELILNISKFAKENNLLILKMQKNKENLEDIFSKLTK